jgi:hypothetical protein
MTSKTEICNLALTLLGQKTITSLTEATVSAQKCNLLYDLARDSTLRSHSWNFATRILELTEISDETVTGWDYLYLYPTNALYIKKVFSDETTTELAEAEKFQEVLSPDTDVKAIATNATPAYCEYIEKVLDVSLYDSLFILALAYMLAAQLAQPLTGDTKLFQTMLNMYMQTIDQAKYYNATEGNAKSSDNNSYIAER